MWFLTSKFTIDDNFFLAWERQDNVSLKYADDCHMEFRTRAFIKLYRYLVKWNEPGVRTPVKHTEEIFLQIFPYVSHLDVLGEFQILLSEFDKNPEHFLCWEKGNVRFSRREIKSRIDLDKERSYTRRYSLLVNAISYYQLTLLVLLPLLLVIAIDSWYVPYCRSASEITISIAPRLERTLLRSAVTFLFSSIVNDCTKLRISRKCYYRIQKILLVFLILFITRYLE